MKRQVKLRGFGAPAPVRGAPALALAALLGGCAMLPGGVPGRPTPIADRPISLEGECVQTEDDGFSENARLSVRNNQVTALSWQMRIG